MQAESHRGVDSRQRSPTENDKIASRMSGRAIAAAAFGYILAAGAQTHPAFEVAAIKASDTTSPVGIRRLPGGRFVTSNTSLRLLITWTYDIGMSV
jgi:hypothetical protein